MFYKSTVLVGLVAMGATSVANAGTVHVGDFRIGALNYPAFTHFDPGFGLIQTRGADVDGDISNGFVPAPVNIFSQFTGGSQNSDGVLDALVDPGLKTFSASTIIKNLTRFKPNTVVGLPTGPERIGMTQWNFDLTPLETYLTDNSLSLTALDLGLNIDVSDHGKKYDFYLSYTNPAESITQASVDSTTVDVGGDGTLGAGGLNFDNFYIPARGAAAGDIVNGTHKVLAIDQVSLLNLSESLLPLYDAGVRNFNLQLAAGDFWSGRQIKILEGSGLSIDTAAATIAGDLDSDGFVGITDLNVVLSNWNLTVTPGNPLQGDPTGDGFVGIEDLNIVLGNWNAGTPPASNAVPEPATLGLMALGGAALLRRRA